MLSINKGHIGGVIAFIVGISIGMLCTNTNTSSINNVQPDLKVWTFSIVHSPQYKRNLTVLDPGTTTFYIPNKEEAERLQLGVFNYLVDRTKLVQ